MRQCEAQAINYSSPRLCDRDRARCAPRRVYVCVPTDVVMLFGTISRPVVHYPAAPKCVQLDSFPPDAAAGEGTLLVESCGHEPSRGFSSCISPLRPISRRAKPRSACVRPSGNRYPCVIHRARCSSGLASDAIYHRRRGECTAAPSLPASSPAPSRPRQTLHSAARCVRPALRSRPRPTSSQHLHRSHHPRRPGSRGRLHRQLHREKVRAPTVPLLVHDC